MSRKVYFPALVTDIQQGSKRYRHLIFNNWIWAGIGFMLYSWFDLNAMFFIVMLSLVLTIYINRYLAIKKLKKEHKVLLFYKKKNEHIRSLYSFLAFIFLGWITADEPYMLMFILFVATLFLIRFCFFVPSLVFYVNDDELIISRKHKVKKIDFSYPNRLRFHNNRLLFIHPTEGEIVWKDIKMNRDRMNEIKTFLRENFGNEMILNPTTGLPYNN